jgi:hypothetical protein
LAGPGWRGSDDAFDEPAACFSWAFSAEDGWCFAGSGVSGIIEDVDLEP